jgi:hypothetical protein
MINGSALCARAGQRWYRPEAMVDRETFDRIEEKHGPYASWAVWPEPDGRPKSNMGDLTVLDPDRNPALLGMLRSDVVMVGLNLSRGLPLPLATSMTRGPALRITATTSRKRLTGSGCSANWGA